MGKGEDVPSREKRKAHLWAMTFNPSAPDQAPSFPSVGDRQLSLPGPWVFIIREVLLTLLTMAPC